MQAFKKSKGGDGATTTATATAAGGLAEPKNRAPEETEGAESSATEVRPYYMWTRCSCCTKFKRMPWDMNGSEFALLNSGDAESKKEILKRVLSQVEAKQVQMLNSQFSFEESTIIKKHNIVKILDCQLLTEREIMLELGDSRYTREVLRRLVREKKIYRIGQGGIGDPYRYVAAEYYQGSDKVEDGKVEPYADHRMLRLSKKIREFFFQTASSDPVSEKEIRACCGDNVGIGKALRYLVSIGHVARTGRGGAGELYKYSMTPAGLEAGSNQSAAAAVDASGPSPSTDIPASAANTAPTAVAATTTTTSSADPQPAK